jgi:hypothetical protein
MTDQEGNGAPPPPTLDYDADADAIGSYYAAIKACGERYKAGEPLGEFFYSTRES